MMKNLIESVDIGHIILVITTLASGIYSIYLRKSSRREQIEDRKYENRHKAYSSFIKRIDDLQGKIRPNLSDTINTPDNLFTSMVTATSEKEISKIFLKWNDHMLSTMDRALEPIMILKGEMNAIYLDSSDEVITLLDRYKSLADDFHTKVSDMLKLEKPKSIDQATSRWDNISKMAGIEEMFELDKKIKEQMRKEMQL